MKKILFVSLLMLLSVSVFAQYGFGKADVGKGFIGISFGPSIPLGDLADNSNTNPKAGFAKAGMNLSLIQYGYRLNDSYGIAGNWLGIACPFDVGGNEGVWGIGALMVGPMKSFRINNNLLLDIKGLFGFTTVTYEYNDYDIEEESDMGLGYDLGANLRLNLSPNFVLTASGDYFSTEGKFEVWDQPVDLLNFSVGLAYRLK